MARGVHGYRLLEAGPAAAPGGAEPREPDAKPSARATAVAAQPAAAPPSGGAAGGGAAGGGDCMICWDRPAPGTSSHGP